MRRSFERSTLYLVLLYTDAERCSVSLPIGLAVELVPREPGSVYIEALLLKQAILSSVTGCIAAKTQPFAT